MPVVLKSGSLKILEPAEPVHACNGNALPLQPKSTVSLTKIIAETVTHRNLKQCNNRNYVPNLPLNTVVITKEYGLFKEKLARKCIEFLNAKASNLFSFLSTCIPCILISSKFYLPPDAQLNCLNTLRTGDADLRF